MALIQGITIKLYERTKTGVDAFNAPVYTDIPVDVENVLVSPAGSSPVVDDMQLKGTKISYDLCIPKGDTHVWKNRTVEFFGQKWKVVGIPEEWIPQLVPLGWNRRVRVERYE